MSRYTPPVPTSRYRMTFVPIIDQGGKKEGGEGDSGVGSEDEAAVTVSSRKELRGHMLRCARFCWCDRETRGLMMKVKTDKTPSELWKHC